jgi:hypothetical protein
MNSYDKKIARIEQAAASGEIHLEPHQVRILEQIKQRTHMSSEEMMFIEMLFEEIDDGD